VLGQPAPVIISALRLPDRRAAVVAWVVGVALVLLGSSGASTVAAAPPRDASAHADDDAFELRLRDGAPATPGPHAGGGGGGGGGAGSTAPRPVVEVVKHVIACPGNRVDTPSEAVVCTQAAAACDPPRLLHWRYAAPAGQPLRLDGTRCLTAAEAAAGDGAAFPGFTVDELRRLPLPPGGVLLEPGNGYALTGVPLNAVAEAAALVLPADVAGFAVQVRATPVSYTWDFGDGTVLGPTADPGSPWEPGRGEDAAGGTRHTYLRGGAVAVVLTTTYAGEFSVDGGPFQPVVGTAAVASPAVPLGVLEGRGALVGGATRR